MVFECRHNIPNQPVSTAIPSPNSFRDITTKGTHQHFGKILKDIFFRFFLQDSMAQYVIFTHKNKFFLFIINLRILSFSRVGFSLSSIKVPKHYGLPQHLSTPPTNNTILLLLTPTGNESASLEYLIDTIFKIEFQQIYLAHYQPKNSELTVELWIRTQYNKV